MGLPRETGSPSRERYARRARAAPSFLGHRIGVYARFFRRCAYAATSATASISPSPRSTTAGRGRVVRRLSSHPPEQRHVRTPPRRWSQCTCWAENRASKSLLSVATSLSARAWIAAIASGLPRRDPRPSRSVVHALSSPTNESLRPRKSRNHRSSSGSTLPASQRGT